MHNTRSTNIKQDLLTWEIVEFGLTKGSRQTNSVASIKPVVQSDTESGSEAQGKAWPNFATWDI